MAVFCEFRLDLIVLPILTEHMQFLALELQYVLYLVENNVLRGDAAMEALGGQRNAGKSWRLRCERSS
jgi:hypothetical protein